MRHPAHFSLALLALASVALHSTARADDKKKLREWQMQQQQLQQQWKQQEVQRQQQLLQKHQAQKRSAVLAAPGSPWGVNQNGRGSMSFSGGVPDRLNFTVVTLNNFFDARGNPTNGGSATVTLYGSYSYPWRGTWSMQGNLTVGLNLTPAANAVRGDRATGNLTTSPPNGARVSRITLTGLMSGTPFTANFTSP